MHRKNPSVGFDIDDVIFPTGQYIVDILSVLYPDISIDQCTGYGLEKTFPYIPRYMIANAVDRAVYEVSEPFENSVEVLRELPLVYFVTSRPENTRQRTLEQIKNILPDVPFVIFHKDDKTDTVDRLNLDYFFEDRLDHAERIRDNTRCKPVIYDRPWNQSSNGFPKVKNWIEISNLIKNKGSV